MTIQPADLRALPLFAAMSDAHLTSLLGAMETRRLAEGEGLFEENTLADRLILLTEGEIAVHQGLEERFRLRPLALVGELGGLTGLKRSSTALATKPSEVLSIGIEALLRYFEQHSDVAYPFYRSILGIVSDKLVRDRRRMAEMRQNIITTQKVMKTMRTALLDADDSPLHRLLFEELDALIEQNRKGHYLVDAPKALGTRLRLDDGSLRDVEQLSNEWLHVCAGPGAAPAKGSEWSGVLVTPDAEIPISGVIEEVNGEAFTVNLDTMIEEYTEGLEQHLTRLQMLDIVLLAGSRSGAGFTR
ncbi:MAG: cyclic nucleotide-binding domain-containing protein [Myxococcales bacterium]|nr:MAG: cyclic nucleotide-binding domain-containing protein [Myxococcales bacterium]